MKISNDEFLKRMLNSKINERENINIQHRIEIAVYNSKKEKLNSEIDALQNQLSKE